MLESLAGGFTGKDIISNDEIDPSIDHSVVMNHLLLFPPWTIVDSIVFFRLCSDNGIFRCLCNNRAHLTRSWLLLLPPQWLPFVSCKLVLLVIINVTREGSKQEILGLLGNVVINMSYTMTWFIHRGGEWGVVNALLTWHCSTQSCVAGCCFL